MVWIQNLIIIFKRMPMKKPQQKFVKLCRTICEEIKKGIDKHYNRFYKAYVNQFTNFVSLKLQTLRPFD